MPHIQSSAGSLNYAIKFDVAQDKDVIRTVSGSYTVPKTPQPFTYDPDGNMLSDGTWTYTWNGENRLITAEKSDAKLEFAYDFMGRRFSKKDYTGTPGNWTLASEKKFVYDGYKQIGEFDGSNTLQRSYIWQPGSVGQDVPLWVKDGANIYYYIVDGNKNVRALIDSSGSVVAEYDYNPFGKITSQTGAMAEANPFRFSSEYFDKETGLIYFNYRYYSPGLGRWLSRDPIEENDNPNLYVFTANNPVNKWDVLGLAGRGACSWSVSLCSRNVVIGDIDLPDKLQKTIGGLTLTIPIPKSIQNKINSNIPDHHSVKIARYSEKDCKGEEFDSVIVGLDADNFATAIAEYALSEISSLFSDGWVSGTIKDYSGFPGTCRKTCVSKKQYENAKRKIGNVPRPYPYHLGKNNCQHWASSILK